jgi:putative ABC transport system ATP-binding protein
VWLDGDEVSAKGEDELIEVRREKIGFVFQSFGLIPILTAAENIEIPLRLRRVDPDERGRRVAELLELVGLAGRASHRPYELSGGEQQRVAICRALANRPRLLIADEPTAQLDSANALTIMELVRQLVTREGVSAVVATHDPLLLDVADVVVELRDGRVR